MNSSEYLEQHAEMIAGKGGQSQSQSQRVEYNNDHVVQA